MNERIHERIHEREHEPDPSFVEHLEWQLATALRREERFARPASGGTLRWMRTAALMLLCIAVGAGGVVGAERLHQSREKELLLARNSVQVETARQLLDLEQRRLERAEQLAEVGRLGLRSVGEARVSADEVLFELKRLELDGEEIDASGRTPDRELTAPLVDGRDFVSEGLRLERQRVGVRQQQSTAELERVEQLAAAGLVTEAEASKPRQEHAALEESLRALDERLALRADFLLGHRDARTTTLLDLRAEARHALSLAERTIEAIRANHQRLESLAGAGVAGRAELEESEAALHRAEGELEARRLELASLDEKLGG